jgi:hypothetical protein
MKTTRSRLVSTGASSRLFRAHAVGSAGVRVRTTASAHAAPIHVSTRMVRGAATPRPSPNR